MNPKKWLGTVFLSALMAFIGGCGMSTTTPPNQNQTQGTVFVTGTDASLPSVTSFLVDITGLSVSDGTNSVSVLNGTQTVDFARLNGLRTLLDINTIPAGA